MFQFSTLASFEIHMWIPLFSFDFMEVSVEVAKYTNMWSRICTEVVELLGMYSKTIEVFNTTNRGIITSVQFHCTNKKR